MSNLFGIVGPSSSSIAPSVIDAAHNTSHAAAPVTIVGMAVSSSLLKRADLYPNFVRVSSSNSQQASVVAQFMFDMDW